MKQLTSKETSMVVIALRDHIKTLKEIHDNSMRLKDMKFQGPKVKIQHDWEKEIAEYEALIEKLKD